MPQGPLVAVGRPVLTFGGLEEHHLEGKYPDNMVSHCQGLAQEAEEQPHEFLLVEDGEQELPSVLALLKLFHTSVG